jgi:hypothetical protein
MPISIERIMSGKKRSSIAINGVNSMISARFRMLSLVILSLLVCFVGSASAMDIGGDQAWFDVYCNEAGADVSFDSEFKGLTGTGPLSVPVYTTGAPYSTIVVSKSGFVTYTAPLPAVPSPGETRNIYVTLNPVQPPETTGSIRVTSNPSGATIYLNGNYRGTTPLTISKVAAPATYSIEADLAGYRSSTMTVSAIVGQTTNVNMALTPVSVPGTLSINSNPSNAFIYVDGVYKGRTPLTLYDIAAQSHNIELDLNGYYDWKTTITVPQSGTKYIDAQLIPVPSANPGFIAVSSSPAGASVTVDGTYKGQTSASQSLVISNVAAGGHTVAISLGGYQTYQQSISVQSGTTSYVSATLTPLAPGTTGSVSVSSSPSGANVYIDNAYKGITPITLDSIAAGTHTVKVDLGGYQDWSQSVQVNAGATTPVSASLSPVPTTPAQSGALPLAVLGALGVFCILFAARRRE